MLSLPKHSLPLLSLLRRVRVASTTLFKANHLLTHSVNQLANHSANQSVSQSPVLKTQGLMNKVTASVLTKKKMSPGQQENRTRKPSVELQGVNKYYDDCHALKDINLTINHGEFISFLGPSGCGKTTLLRTIAGLEDSSDGIIYLSGKNVTNKPARQRNFGIVFQSYALFPNLTVEENIGYALKSKGQSKKTIKERVNELIELVGLAKLNDRFPSQLSGGQQQRVALARALAPNPKLLLLDEPLSALDAKVRHTLRSELKQLQQKTGITTIMVTHDQEEALAISDRIAVLKFGEIEQIGTPDEIYSTPATEFVAEFVGTINKLTLPHDGQSYIVRPEWIELFNTPNENRIPGVIEDVEYHGASTRVTLDLDNPKISAEPVILDIPTPHFKKMQFSLSQLAWLEVTHLDMCSNSIKQNN